MPQPLQNAIKRLHDKAPDLDKGVTPWVRLACHYNNVPELAQAIVIEWNRRFTRRLGDAVFNPITFQSRIRLSIPLWPRASPQDRMETVVHEACHLIAWHKFGLFVAPHGAEWRQAMKNCGVQPDERTTLIGQVWPADNGDSSFSTVQIKAPKINAG